VEAGKFIHWLDLLVKCAGHFRTVCFDLFSVNFYFTGDFQCQIGAIFTDFNKKQYKESFSFQPILLKEIPGVIKRKDLVLELDGLNSKEYIRVLLTDTSTSDGINRVDTVRNGLIMLTKEDLSGLVNGPLHLELIKEDERPLKNGTKKGGKLSISYGLQRDLILEN